MDERTKKLLHLWMLIAQSRKVPEDQISSAVYFGLTNQPPPPDLTRVTTALGLCEYLKEKETGTPFSQQERLALAKDLVEATSSGRIPSLAAVRFLGWLPNIALALAIIAVTFASFSWIVIATGLAAKLHSGFPRYLAAHGHKAAGLHIGISIFLIISSLTVSATHLLSGYRFA